MIVPRIHNRAKPGHIELDLSANEQTSAGKMLYQLYYKSSSDELMSLAPEISGFPHNGGVHTMRVIGPYEDVFAWFALLRERYEKISQLEDWFNEIQRQIGVYLRYGRLNVEA